jgi:hypothetical protein
MKANGCLGWIAAGLVGLMVLGSLPRNTPETPPDRGPSPVLDVYQTGPQPSGPCPPAMTVGPCVHWESFGLDGTKTAGDWLALTPEDRASVAAVAAIRLGGPAFGDQAVVSSLAMAACINRTARRNTADTSLRAIITRCP